MSNCWCPTMSWNRTLLGSCKPLPTGLCELIDATQAIAVVESEALHNLDPAHLPPDAGVVADALADALELSIVQMRLAAAMACEALGDHERAGAIRAASARDTRFVQCTSETQLLLRESRVPRLTLAPIPLIRPTSRPSTVSTISARSADRDLSTRCGDKC